MHTANTAPALQVTARNEAVDSPSTAALRPAINSNRLEAIGVLQSL